MQAWWTVSKSVASPELRLDNSFGIAVSIRLTTDGLRWEIHDKFGILSAGMPIEEAKNIVAHKFAVMLIEQATAVLTIGA